MHVLVVEDDSAIGELMSLILDEAAHVATGVRTTTQAMFCLETGNVDPIVADLEPRLYGDTLWGRITQLRESAPSTPIIVCTGHSEAAKALPSEYGVSAIIMKPFELDDFVTHVRRFAGISHPIR